MNALADLIRFDRSYGLLRELGDQSLWEYRTFLDVCMYSVRCAVPDATRYEGW